MENNILDGYTAIPSPFNGCFWWVKQVGETDYLVTFDEALPENMQWQASRKKSGCLHQMRECSGSKEVVLAKIEEDIQAEKDK